MDQFKSVLEDYDSYIRQQDVMFEKIEASKELEIKSRLEKEMSDLLGAIHSTLGSLATNNGSGTGESGFLNVREGLLKELNHSQSLRDTQVATKEEKTRERTNLDEILSDLKHELVLIQKENEAIEAKLNDQDSLHLILKLMKSN